MQARRRWAPVAEAFTNDPTGVPSAQRPGVAATWPGAGNARYVSCRALLDIHPSPSRFVPQATIEGWRETIRRDPDVRAALLNPARREPRRR
jgi:hypothetical protein